MVILVIARISAKSIVIQEAWSYWDLRDVLDGVNQILLHRRYKPVYFFEGTPVLGQGGFSVIIKLDRELGELERKSLKHLLENRGVKVIEEDKL